MENRSGLPAQINPGSRSPFAYKLHEDRQKYVIVLSIGKNGTNAPIRIVGCAQNTTEPFRKHTVIPR